MPDQQQGASKGALATLVALVGVGTASALITDTKVDEGVIYHEYADLGGVLSICSGSTHGVKPGEVDTVEQCDARTAADLAKAATIVLKVAPNLKDPAHHNQIRAAIRFQNNTGKFPVSTGGKLMAQGQYRAGCDALLAYDGIVSARPIKGAVKVRRLSDGRYFNEIGGLMNRRANEHALCVEGL